MAGSEPDFYLASTEHGEMMREPRRAYRIKRLRGDHRDDYLLIRVDPPFIGQLFGLGARDVHEVIVATRHKGDTLFPVSEWPVDVHVARVLPEHPERREIIHDDELEGFAWATLYPTEESARRKRTSPDTGAGGPSPDD